jgi:hypothetical protein
MVALAPAGASAATAGWKVNGSLLTTTARVTTASVDQEYRLTAAGINIECQSSNVNNINAYLVPPNKLLASSIVLMECSVVESTACSITKSVGIVPTVAEVTLDGLLAVKATIKPETKTLFATLRFEGETCALLGVQPITGQGSALGPTNQDERTVQQANSTTTAASGELKVGSSAAAVTGIGLGRLASTLTWSFL